jgi:ABC-2 type transport system permease protein
MTSDVWTMAWKEWKELFARSGRLRGGVVNFLLVLAVFGIVIPLQFGRAWVESPSSLIL